MLVFALLIATVFSSDAIDTSTCDGYAAACMADANCATRNGIVGGVLSTLPMSFLQTGDFMAGEFSYLDFSIMMPQFHATYACYMFDFANNQFDPIMMMAVSCYANLYGFMNTVDPNLGIVDMMLGVDEDGNPIPLCGCHTIAAACAGDTSAGGCLQHMDAADNCGMSEGAPKSDIEDPYWASGPRKQLNFAGFSKDDWCTVGQCYQDEADPQLQSVAMCMMDKLGGDLGYCIDKVMAHVMLILILSNLGSAVGVGLMFSGVYFCCLRKKKN